MLEAPSTEVNTRKRLSRKRLVARVDARAQGYRASGRAGPSATVRETYATLTRTSTRTEADR